MVKALGKDLFLIFPGIFFAEGYGQGPRQRPVKIFNIPPVSCFPCRQKIYIYIQQQKYPTNITIITYISQISHISHRYHIDHHMYHHKSKFNNSISPQSNSSVKSTSSNPTEAGQPLQPSGLCVTNLPNRLASASRVV